MSEKMSGEDRREWREIVTTSCVLLVAICVLVWALPIVGEALAPVITDVQRQLANFMTPSQFR